MSSDNDGPRSNVLGTVGEAMTGPLTAGAQTDVLPVTPQGRVTLPAGLWEPLLLVGPRADVMASEIVVTATVDAKTLPPVRFAPWTERGAALPLLRPALAVGQRSTLAATEVTLAVTVGGEVLPAGQVAAAVEVTLLSGAFGRLYYLMQAETPRLRRLIRQIASARALNDADAAAGAMLDRIGQELAVPRQSDHITTVNGQIVTEEAREADASYRRRLAIYRPFLMPTRGHLKARLNEGQPAGNPRFLIDEADNPFSIALRLVSVAGTQAAATVQRHNYLRFLRETVLVDPGVDVPASRRLPQSRRAQQQATRLRLRSFLSFAGPSRALAPALAAAFDRAALIAAELGTGLKLEVLRAQEDDGGSRWELGLAAEIRLPASADIEALAQKLRTTDPSDLSGPAAQSLWASLHATLPAPGAASLEWLMRGCGMRTLHPLAADRMMVSHFSTAGLVIDGPSDLDAVAAQGASFTAALRAPNDASANAALAHALAGGAAGWPAGGPPWTVLAGATLTAAIAGLALPPSGLTNRLRVLGLPAGFSADHFRQALASYPPALFAVLELTAPVSAALLAGTAVAWDDFAAVIEQLAQSGAASAALMLGPDNRLHLVVSSAALPILTTNLAARRTAGFVWRALPVTEGTRTIRGAGSRGLWQSGPGIGAVAVVGYARQGLTDPFEYRVTAAEGSTLDIAEYEYLMNALRHMTPAGVQANTWDIRRRNVVLDPARGPEPLPVSLTRAFRPFRRPRFSGAEAPPVPQTAT